MSEADMKDNKEETFTRQRYSDTDLRNAGAQQGGFPLWKRSDYGVVTDQKP